MLTLADKLLACYYTGIPACVWGDPGVGKSASIEYLAKKLDIHLETIISSIREPSDFCGLPVKIDDGVKMIPPQWAKNFEDKDGGIVFFDELATCTPNIQAALLNIVLTGNVGEYKLPKSTYRVAASNFTNCEGNNELNPALGNRFIHLIQTCDTKVFCELLEGNFEYDLINIMNNKKLDSYPKIHEKYRKLIAQFLRDNNGRYTNIFPQEIAKPLDYAFPTPRSWTMLAEVLATLEGSDLNLIKELIIGCVGEDAGKFFFKFIKNKIGRKYIVADHLTDYKSTFDPNKLTVDECELILDEILDYVKYNTKLNRNIDNDLIQYHMDKIKSVGYSGLVVSYENKIRKLEGKVTDSSLTTELPSDTAKKMIEDIINRSQLNK